MHTHTHTHTPHTHISILVLLHFLCVEAITSLASSGHHTLDRFYIHFSGLSRGGGKGGGCPQLSAALTSTGANSVQRCPPRTHYVRPKQKSKRELLSLQNPSPNKGSIDRTPKILPRLTPGPRR